MLQNPFIPQYKTGFDILRRVSGGSSNMHYTVIVSIKYTILTKQKSNNKRMLAKLVWFSKWWRKHKRKAYIWKICTWHPFAIYHIFNTGNPSSYKKWSTNFIYPSILTESASTQHSANHPPSICHSISHPRLHSVRF